MFSWCCMANVTYGNFIYTQAGLQTVIWCAVMRQKCDKAHWMQSWDFLVVCCTADLHSSWIPIHCWIHVPHRNFLQNSQTFHSSINHLCCPEVCAHLLTNSCCRSQYSFFVLLLWKCRLTWKCCDSGKKNPYEAWSLVIVLYVCLHWAPGRPTEVRVYEVSVSEVCL